MAHLEHKLLKQATAQVLANQLTYGEEHGARAWKAIAKAEIELKENGSISFENSTLTFVSRFSAKQRMVTAAGCHESCDCTGQYSYHKALFDILTRYNELEAEEMFAAFPEATPQDELQARAKQAGTEYKAFANSLPLWVKDEAKQFDLWLMSGDERNRWIQDNAPLIKPTSTYKPQRLGSVRF
jgi:hypothetical protein